MINIISSTLISRPVKQVFEFISTPENDVQWQYGALAAFQTSEGSMGKGAVIGSMGHFLGRRIQSTFEVTEYEPNQRYEFKSLSGPIQLQTSYAFEITPGGTKVNASTQVSQDGFFELSDALVGKLVKKQIKENLAKLKDLLEASNYTLRS